MPSLYSATYLNVPVYEYIVNDVSVMRRKHDGWVNATHILKAAKFPKAKRTRILEKEVQVGRHEKVQGGYGKYQGTWIPLEEAKRVAQQYHIYDQLSPILTHEQKPGVPEPPLAPRHQHAKSAPRDSPMLAGRSITFPLAKRPAKEPTGPPRKRGRPRRIDLEVLTTLVGEFDMLKTFEDKVELTKAGVPKKKRGRKPKSKTETEPEEVTGNAIPIHETPIKGDISSRVIRSFVDEKSLPLNESDLHTYFDSHLALGDDDEDGNERAVHLRKILENDPSSSPNVFGVNMKSPGNLSGLGIKTTPQRLRPLQRVGSQLSWFFNSDEFTRRIIGYFMKPDDEIDDTAVPAFLKHLPENFDVNKVIDPEGNTTLHWACAMGHVPITELLLRLGADNKLRNRKDEIPITRCVKFNNSYGKRTFSKMLDLLRDTIFETDSKNKTLLHHIAIALNGAQRSNSLRYYAELLLAKISDLHLMERLAQYINAQDKKGNTALFYAVCHLSRKLVKVLLSHGARSSIKNSKGQCADDILVMNPSTPAAQKEKPDLSSIPRAVQEPRYSEKVLAATEKCGFSLMGSLNKLSEAYDEELQKKTSLLEDLNKYYAELSAELATIERNVARSANEPNESPELFDTIITKHQKLLDDKIKLQERILSQKSAHLRALLGMSQNARLGRSPEDQNTSTSGLEEETNLKKVEMIIEVVALGRSSKRLENGIVGQFSITGSKKVNLYRRLVAACCDIGIDKVDELLDVVLESLEK